MVGLVLLVDSGFCCSWLKHETRWLCMFHIIESIIILYGQCILCVKLHNYFLIELTTVIKMQNFDRVLYACVRNCDYRTLLKP